MPMHDWTRVSAGRYHHFHQNWITAIAAVLNAGRLPPGYFALAEQRVQGPEPDVVALELPGTERPAGGSTGGIAVAVTPPKARFVIETDVANYARRADRLSVRDDEGRVVAVIEVVSPGNKDGRHAIRAFIAKAIEFMEAGVHLLIVDPLPPTKRDPDGIHRAIWDEISEGAFELPADKRLTLVAYAVGSATTAYVEPVAVGDTLPDMPIFLTESRYVACPLEAAYQRAWNDFPAALKPLVEPPPG